MKKLIPPARSIFLLLAMSVGSPSLGAEFFVATNGNDEHPGTKSQPFASLERARDAVRSLPAASNEETTVWIRGGDYFRSKTFVLNKSDSGASGRRVVYRAYGEEEVRLVGGIALAPDWFSKVTDSSSVWSRISPEARGRVMCLNLKDHGITDYGRMSPRGDGFRRPRAPAAMELFFDDVTMPLARWPNSGFAYTLSVPEGTDGAQFKFADDRPERWTGAEDIWLGGYWKHPYIYDCVPVAEINQAAKEIKLAVLPPSGLAENRPYFAMNILEELDMPGEWFLDRSTGVLYFWPPRPLEKSRILISIMEEYLLHLVDVSHVTIQGLTFEACRGHAIMMYRGAHNRLAGCVVRNAGQSGVQMHEGFDNVVTDCVIHGCGEDGIFMKGGDRKSLSPCENAAVNNRIHHCARWCRANCPAIRIDGVGCKISHNVIHDMPHYGVWYMGNDHTMEFNDIYRVCAETADAGAVYAGFGWDKRGTQIRHNFIHHVKKTAKNPEGVHGIYLDDCGSGDVVTGNILYEIDGAGIFVGGGRDNLIANNVLVRCERAVHIDARGTRRISNTPGDPWNLLEKIEQFDYKNPPWSAKYPALTHILDQGIEEAKKPKGNVLERNIGYENGVWLHEGKEGNGGREYLSQKNNLIGANPEFVDAEHMDMRLKDDSPAFKIPGFENIPFEKIGLSRAAP